MNSGLVSLDSDPAPHIFGERWASAHCFSPLTARLLMPETGDLRPPVARKYRNVRIHRAAMNEGSSSSRLAPRLRCNGLLWIAADSEILPHLGRDLNFTAINIDNQIGQATDIFHQLRSQKSSKAVQT